MFLPTQNLNNLHLKLYKDFFPEWGFILNLFLINLSAKISFNHNVNDLSANIGFIEPFKFSDTNILTGGNWQK